MSGKFVLKVAIAFGVLAALLVFLGVNYVPRISALSSARENSVEAAKYAGSDYAERHPSGGVVSANSSESGIQKVVDNPELLSVQRYASAESAQNGGYDPSLVDNPELLLHRRFSANSVNAQAPLYKILGENPE